MNIQSVKNSVFLENNTKKNAQLKIAPKSPQQKLPTAQISSEHLRGAFGVVDAKVLNLSFGSTPLYPINLREKTKNGDCNLVPGSFSQIKREDDKDKKEIELINRCWWEKYRDLYTREMKIYKDVSKLSDYFGDVIIGSFLLPFDEVDSEYYAIEKTDNSSNNLGDKITCLIETTNSNNQNKKDFHIKFLQANPEFINNDKAIRGNGEMALYGAVKIAKENGFKQVSLYSANDSFYKNLGLKADAPYSTRFVLPKCEFDEFLDRVEKKYNIKDKNI